MWASVRALLIGSKSSCFLLLLLSRNSHQLNLQSGSKSLIIEYSFWAACCIGVGVWLLGEPCEAKVLNMAMNPMQLTKRIFKILRDTPPLRENLGTQHY